MILTYIIVIVALVVFIKFALLPLRKQFQNLPDDK
jgi:hypothetical protein